MRALAWLVAVGLLVAVPSSAEPREGGSRPNVLVITADTWRADHLGVYGHSRPTSPNIDRLASKGVVFRHAYTTSAWTTPGLISLLAAQYAPTHGVDVRGKSLRPSVVTLADALRSVGYRAPDIFFLTDIPNFHNLGFERYYKRREYIRLGDDILFRWLAEEAPRSDEPFFLYYHYRDLHQPYHPGAEYEDLYLDEAFGPSYSPLTWARRHLAADKMAIVKREVMLPRHVIDFYPWDRGWVTALYDAQINRLDTQFFGRLERVLAETGLADNTIIVLSADHGEELLEHGLVGHVSTFKEGHLVEELVRIPLIFVGPGLPAGRVIDERVQVIDTMPTLLDLVGAPPAQTAQGRSLMPLVTGEGRSPKPLFFETSAGGYTASLELYTRRTRAVIDGDWKLVTQGAEDDVALYDLAADPTEDDDRAGSEPERVARLQRLLADWQVWSRPPPIERSPDTTDAPAAPSSGGTVVIEVPQDGDTLYYAGADQTVQVRWTGEPGGRYRVLYDVGTGVYHLEGEMDVDSNAPVYGPFQEEFWNAVALYSPFTVRVHPVDRPDLISAPITFHMAHTEGAGLAGGATMLVAGIAAFGDDLLTLAAGSLLGLVDLSVWVTDRVSAADVTAWALLLAIAGALAWPRLERLGADRVRAWMWLLGYTGVVYATLSVFPTIWAGLRLHAGDSVRHLGTIAVVVAGAYVLVALYRRVGVAPAAFATLAVLLGVYAVLLVRFGQYPAERLHLLEYGLMSVLALRAMRTTVPGITVAYLGAWLLTVVIGFGDELIQLVLPERVFELKDVGLNAVSAALGLCLARLVRGGESS